MKKMYNSPLEQFRATNFFKIYNNYFDFSFTKTSLFLILSFLFIVFLGFIFNNSLLANRYRRLFELVYEAWSKQIYDVLGPLGSKYIVFIISLFLFIVSNNLIGMVPYSYTTTSQIIVTLTLSLSIFLGVTFTGVLLHGYKFIYLFIPSGIPFAILPLLFFIELLSYFFRIISLSVRLTGNIVAGHTILKIISNLGCKLSNFSVFLLILPFLFIFLLIGLEIAVAIIQSYVFAVLTTTYIKDALYLH